MLDPPPRAQPSARTGATPTRGTGVGTILFFAVIILVVAAAGTVGVLLWGPDKVSTIRSHHASDPAADATDPTLALSTPGMSPDPSTAPASPSAVPDSNGAPAAAGDSTGVKKKRSKSKRPR
jgi:hypothetical protein